MIKQACQNCAREFNIPEKYLGKRIKCPSCAAVITVHDRVKVSVQVVSEQSSAETSATPPVSKTERPVPLRNIKASYHFPWFDPFVAMAMLALAVGYVALIFGILAGVAYHTFNNYKRIIDLGDEASFFVFVVYIGIIIVGLAVAFFLLKPVLSKRQKSISRRVTRKTEPALFLLLKDISNFFSLAPVSICELENHFDIVARHSRNQQGDESMILGIGFPVMVNLNQQQAASMIAQEMIEKSLEHQSPIARLIRAIHSWFFDAAQIRDSWDHWLSRIRFRRGVISTPVVMLIQLCVFLNRRVLWFFFIVSQLVSNISFRSYYRRAAEYAMSYTGDDSLLDFTRDIPVTRKAFHTSLRQFIQSYHTSSAVDDVAGLVEAERKRMDKASILATEMRLSKQWTRPWESRPNLRAIQRLAARVGGHKSRSYFGSAKQLFTNFKSLSRKMTGDIHEFLMMGDFVQVRDLDRRMLNIGLTKRLPTGMAVLQDIED